MSVLKNREEERRKKEAERKEQCNNMQRIMTPLFSGSTQSRTRTFFFACPHISNSERRTMRGTRKSSRNEV